MERMLDIQEKRLELDAKQMDISERELDGNHTLALRSLELNAKANTEHNQTMTRIFQWRYIFWTMVGILATVAIITALFLDKEAFVVDAIKYVAIFVGGYGTKSAVELRRKNAPTTREISD